MKRALALALTASVGLAIGCSDPEVDHRPEYGSTDVSVPDVTPVQPPFFGQTLAVVPFVNKSLSEYKNLGDIAPDVLVEFAIAGGWRPIEGQRGQLDAVAEELNFGQTEFVNPNTAAKIGNMLGARYVLIGAVTNFRITRASAKKGVDVLGLVTVGGKKAILSYDCQVSGRIVDVETREIIGAGTAAVEQKYEVGGSKTRVLIVKVEDGEEVEVTRDSMGKVLRIAFAQMINRIHTLTNQHAAMRRATAPPASGGGAAPPQ